MAELLVVLVDKVNPDNAYLDAKCYKRGDVVTVHPDGWRWSAAERSGAEWCIVKVPGADPDDLSGLLAAEPGDPKTQKMLQRRAFKFDLDAHTPGAPLELATVLDTYQKAKSALPDLEVLGGPVGDVL